MRLRISRQRRVKGPAWSVTNADGSSLDVPVWYRYHWTQKRAMDAADLILGRIDIREYNRRGLTVKPVRKRSHVLYGDIQSRRERPV